MTEIEAREGTGPLEAILQEHEQLQKRLADPSVHADQLLARRLNRRYAELDRVVGAHRELQALREDLEAARELAPEAPEFAAEAEQLQARIDPARERLRRLLIPRDPDDARDAILEIKAGEGGAEAALFAGDLLRMYLRFAESQGWKTEVLSDTPADLGGHKDVQIAVKGRSQDPAEGVWAKLKYEGGVHRVQRVPATESQGRIHTSAAGVLAFPEVDAPEEVEITRTT